MPRIVNYPRKSFDTAYTIAETVEKLGGKCTEQLLGDKLGKKRGGGSFVADITAAIKHGLITKEKDNLKITDLYKNITLSYTDDEKNENLIKSFLLPDTYREILERFDKKELPIDVLDKMLIKEYDVANNISQLVANNLIKGAEKLGLIVTGKVSLNKDLLEQAKQDAAEKNIGELVNDQSEITKRKELKADIGDDPSITKKLKESIYNGQTIQKEVVININIQLSVPETTNEEVYEKFFAAMKRNLLS